MKVKSESEVAQLCPTLSDPTDCSPPGSSIHGNFQARALEWVAIAFSSLCLFMAEQCSAAVCLSSSLFTHLLMDTQVVKLLEDESHAWFISASSLNPPQDMTPDFENR